MKNNCKIKVIALVVTYNRKVLLTECLEAILSQTFSVYRLIIIDNASTDGTPELLDEKGILNRKDVIYQRMDTNVGGAGGFNVGLELAQSMGGDWVWLMDDDTIPCSQCLEKLIDCSNIISNTSFLASNIFGEHGEAMNVPRVNETPSENGFPDWCMNLDKKMVKIYIATFVSILINMDAIKKCGLPCRDFFIWGDDTEYTQRLAKYYGDAYLVGDSWACHKRKSAAGLDIKKEDDIDRIKNYFYLYRNSLINFRLYKNKRSYIRNILRYMKIAFSVLFKSNGRLKFKIIFKGIFRSKLDMKTFRDYIEGQLTTCRGIIK